MTSERWSTSVDELVRTFRAGLIALIPIAERARMQWKEPNNYDDWDLISAVLFESIVSRSLAESSEWNRFDAILGYDNRTASYLEGSFLAAKDEPSCAFVCFETDSSPFDTCLFARLNTSNAVVGLERRSIEVVEFVLSGRSGDVVTIVDTVRILL
ncbi:hypothetical protein [Bradyrhizobium monzae]|uniref:hypothetical protein n=1 Tax=Bradyrhizobium sp. Oc8 TaxID=2876780 RepID=UPI001F2EB9E8|nr:hypothetical protein [Bradyrhizobium sp. Oc8]